MYRHNRSPKTLFLIGLVAATGGPSGLWQHDH